MNPIQMPMGHLLLYIFGMFLIVFLAEHIHYLFPSSYRNEIKEKKFCTKTVMGITLLTEKVDTHIYKRYMMNGLT